jgi:hypothetical protein
VPTAAVPVTGRQWCLGTSPGSSSSKPSKKLRISSRLRGQTRSLALSYTATASARADLSGKKSVPMWETAR